MAPGVPVSSEGLGAGTKGTVRTRVGYRSCGNWLEASQHCFWRKATAREGDLAYAVVFNLVALQRPWKHVWNMWTLLFQDTFHALCPLSSFVKSLGNNCCSCFLNIWFQAWRPSCCAFLFVYFHSCSSNSFSSQWLMNFRENLDLDASMGEGVAKQNPQT